MAILFYEHDVQAIGMSQSSIKNDVWNHFLTQIVTERWAQDANKCVSPSQFVMNKLYCVFLTFFWLFFYHLPPCVWASFRVCSMHVSDTVSCTIKFWVARIESYSLLLDLEPVR